MGRWRCGFLFHNIYKAAHAVNCWLLSVSRIWSHVAADASPAFREACTEASSTPASQSDSSATVITVLSDGKVLPLRNQDIELEEIPKTFAVCRSLLRSILRLISAMALKNSSTRSAQSFVFGVVPNQASPVGRGAQIVKIMRAEYAKRFMALHKQFCPLGVRPAPRGILVGSAGRS